MEGDFIKINKWLLPLSWIYGLGVRLRNLLFDMGVLKSRDFSVPVISVGNISVGGTGKTPHVEYLLQLLQEVGRVAVLSRGYKRKTRGFVIAGDTATARSVGDEPLQVKRKFPSAIVAVDANRVRGIERLLHYAPDIEAILLDDAFQHRYVKPGVNILLVDYHRLVVYDQLLPAGRLREPLKGKNRADIVIVTKCPKELKPMDIRVITKAMDLYPYQSLFFTTFDYSALRPVFEGGGMGTHSQQEPGRRQSECFAADALSGHHVLLLTGIASPRQLQEDLERMCEHAAREGQAAMPTITPLAFPDHHRFSAKDVRSINSAFEALPKPRCVITTEKDATRLLDVQGLSDEVRKCMYALPVHVTFMADQEQLFIEHIVGYVRKNSRNSILAKHTEEKKSAASNKTIRFNSHDIQL